MSIRKEIQWIVDAAADPSNFVPVRFAPMHGYEHKKTGLILWCDGDLWRRRKSLPWFCSAHIAANSEERELLYAAGQVLLDTYHEYAKQRAADKTAGTLSKAFEQSDADKKLIESKVEEQP